MSIVLKKIQFANPTDANRCQGSAKKGQCPYLAVEGSQFCPRHGFNSEQAKIAAKDQCLYLSGKYAALIGKHAEHPRLKTLTSEIGVLRMNLDIQLGRIQDDDDLMMRSSKLIELVREIRAVLMAIQSLDEKLGAVLDIGQAKEWIGDVANILSMYIEDPAYVQLIAEHMLTSLDERLAANRKI